ncbi:MerR family transcriptional regulator [Embleya sp. NPDC020630]|uniref:MerR family transcriptional regulator n=1 Tax=Embleya sp. NPDC020630 TaxID=3363979 RepID=UPI003793ACE4
MSWRTIGDVAAEVGVSPQTLRAWEKQDLLVPDRTPGGQRRYGPEHVGRARRIADLRRRHGWNPAAIRTSLGEPDPADATPPAADEPAAEAPADGGRLRRARLASGLSLKELAALTGTSVSHLSSIERGVERASTQLIARITDALGVPMSSLASFARTNASVVRADERASVVLEGGVQWEELLLPGHDLEPALLTIPPHGSSGGPYSRPGESFAFLMSGSLRVRVGGGLGDHERVAEPIDIAEGDSVALPSRTLISWENVGRKTARAIWIEVLSPNAWSDPMTRRIIKAASGFTPPGDDPAPDRA